MINNNSMGGGSITLRHTLGRRRSVITCVAWSPDCHEIAAGDEDSSVNLWDVHTGTLRRIMEGHSGAITSVAWSPDGHLLASAANDKKISLWDAATGDIIQVFEGPSKSGQKISWSPDGRKLAAWANVKTIHLWHMDIGSLQRIRGYDAPIADVAWSPDGRILASGAKNGTIYLRDIETEGMRQIREPGEPIQLLAWASTGPLLACGVRDRAVEAWDTETGELCHKWEGLNKPVETLNWSTDGNTLAAGTSDGNIYIWDIHTGGRSYTPQGGRSGWVRSMEWLSDGSAIVVGVDNDFIRLWKEERKGLFEDNYYAPVPNMALSSDRQLLAWWTNDGTIHLWNSANKRRLHSLKKRFDYEVQAIAWSPKSDALASGGDDGRIRIWDAKTGALRHELQVRSTDFRAQIRSLSWSPYGRVLASGNSNGDIKLWDSITGKLRQTRTGYGATDINMAWSPDGRLVSLYKHGVIELWDAKTGEQCQKLIAKFHRLLGMAWSPSGSMFAAIVDDNVICVWNVQTGVIYRRLISRGKAILCMAWAPDGINLALGIDDKTIHIMNVDSEDIIQILEGHDASIAHLAWSPDARILASGTYNGNIILWRCDTWQMVKAINSPSSRYTTFEISFQRMNSTQEILGNEDAIVRTFDLDINDLLLSSSDVTSVRYTSSKIVLVGESNVGKSCLALRLVHDRYEEQGTTHGMRIWSLSPEQLGPDAITPEGEKRDIILWDMGGQDEYRLIHQLFLHDTTLALIMLDPSRGRTAFEEVEGWNIRLERQLHGRRTVKFLIGTKLDEESRIIDRAEIERIIKDCNISGFYETSAKSGRGISELRSALSKAIDWEMLAKTSRPTLYQHIRDEVERRQRRGEVVLLYSELEEQISQLHTKEFDPDAVNVVTEHLTLQGLISDTRLASGERVLVLQTGEVERYAGSLIIAARDNPRGVPALEERILTSAKMSFPGIKEEDRLQLFQERIVLECVIQLLLEHGICLKHEGLLIFPSLFKPGRIESTESIPYTIPLYYDFSGAIDNIYSSLVVRLAISERFGRVRLWDDRAEFERSGQGLCGIHKIDHRSGLAHLDLYFNGDTNDDLRSLFTVFIEEHLRNEGVNITEVIKITCACGYGFQESSLRKRLESGRADIICPECESRTAISEGATKARVDNPEMERNLLALKTIIDKKNQDTVEAVKLTFEEPVQIRHTEDTIRILHLSDLHINATDDVSSHLQPLVKDIRDKRGGLGFDRLTYLVISGDLTNRASVEEFERAYEFISGLIDAFKLTAERCIIVPGNHDLNWDEKVYEWMSQRTVDTNKLIDGSYIKKDDLYLVRDEKKYPMRFENFSKFYHSLIQQPYPISAEDQCIPFLFEDTRIQFLAMNSAWEIDEFFHTRSSINSMALSRGLINADEQIDKATQEGRLQEGTEVLRIAVWHHPVTGNEKIVDDAFLDRLRQEDVQLCLHGHVHEDRPDLIGYPHPTRQIHIAGAGSFGAPAYARPESVPRLFNLLEVSRNYRHVRVNTRCMRRRGGAWDGWAVWPGQSSEERLTYYDINIRQKESHRFTP